MLILLRALIDDQAVSAILVVDDDPSVRQMLRSLFETEGYEVAEASDGQAALEIIQPNSVPDLVTTDLLMPTLGGRELIERLRSEPETAAIPIVVISGSHEAARDLQTLGLVEAVVAKPFHAITLAQCVRDLSSSATTSLVDGMSHGAA